MDDANDRLVCGFGVEVPDLVGKTAQEDTKEAAAREVDNVRVLDSVGGITITPMTMDWNPTRFTLTVEDRIVVSAVFG
jgi:hypothetical protein